MSIRISDASELGVFATVRRGLRLSPAMVEGIGLTLALAVVATAGRIVVPILIQLVTDHAIMAPGGPDVGGVARLVLAGLAVVVLAGLASAAVNIRLFRASERGLAQLRTRTFRHVHDLSVLTQAGERSGSLVSRVTSDVDTISRFVQFGGLQLILNIGQLLAATVAMLVYSPVLAAGVWLCFLPMFLLAPRAQRFISAAYGEVRLRVGLMLGAVSESIVGAETIRAYGSAARTQGRIDDSVTQHRTAAIKAQTFTGLAFSSGTALAGLALAVTVVAGTKLAVAGDLTLGELLAFLFLVQMFTGPVQNATETLNELQNAVAGWRRVIAVLETPLDVTDPAGAAAAPGAAATGAVAPGAVAPGAAARSRAAAVTYAGVNFAYPGGAPVLHDIDLELPAGRAVAIVGETGSGKTTLAKLLARLMDPTEGQVRLDGTDLRELTLAELRSRVVLVPQEGFLFDGTIATNIGYGPRPHARAAVEQAVDELGLGGWLDTLLDGLDTPVGQRGESLSAGERQLVAIARAHLADADLLVLDEATSAVDPATEGRIAAALERLARGRTSVAIAHRLSTAEAADLVVVVDAGRIVETGSHTELLARGGTYARMHESWVAQTR